MAEELDPVTQDFIADMRQYIEPMAEAIREGTQFATDNKELTAVLKELRDATVENGATLREMRDAMAGANEETRKLRDDAVEAKIGEDQLRDGALEAGTALGHLRDEAMLAKHEVKELGNSAEAASAKLDLMSLSGLSFMGPLLSGMVALVVAAAAVAPAVAAMGLGFAAFGAMALPTIEPVMKALSGGAKAINQLHGPLRTLATDIQTFEASYKKIASAFQPEVIHLFVQAMNIALVVLKEIVPLARAGGQALSYMLGAIQKGVESSGFISFLHTMTALVMPATKAIMGLLGAVMHLVGGLLTGLAPESVPFIHILTMLVTSLGPPVIAALQVIVSTFNILGNALRPLMPVLSQIATTLVVAIGGALKQLAGPLAEIIKAIAQFLIPTFKALKPVIENALTANSPFVSALRIIASVLAHVLPMLGKLIEFLVTPTIGRLAVDIISAVIAFKALLGVISLVKTVMAGLGAVMDLLAANPVGAVITVIALLVIAFIELWKHSAAFRDFWKAVWNDVKTVFLAVWATLKATFTALKDAVKDVVDWIGKHWRLLAVILGTVLLGPIGGLIAFIATHWQQFRSLTSRLVDDVTGFFRALPGRVMGAVARLAGELFTWGQNLILGAIHGVDSMASSLIGHVESVGKRAWHSLMSFFGMGSPSRLMHQFGIFMIQGWMNGITTSASSLISTMRNTAQAAYAAAHGAVTSGFTGGLAGGGVAVAAAGGGGASPAQPLNLTLTMLMPDGRASTQKATLVYNRRNPTNGLAVRVR